MWCGACVLGGKGGKGGGFLSSGFVIVLGGFIRLGWIKWIGLSGWWMVDGRWMDGCRLENEIKDVGWIGLDWITLRESI